MLKMMYRNWITLRIAYYDPTQKNSLTDINEYSNQDLQVSQSVNFNLKRAVHCVEFESPYTNHLKPQITILAFVFDHGDNLDS